MINEPETEVANGNELGTVEQMPPEFELSFKFYINQFPAKGALSNLFHGMNDNRMQCTESTAGFFLVFVIYPNNDKFYVGICTNNGGEAKYIYPSEISLKEVIKLI